MSKCKHQNICNREANYPDNCCILHTNAEKNEIDFRKAFKNHLENNGYDCAYFVIPIRIDRTFFSDNDFSERLNFENSVFKRQLYLYHKHFKEGANFNNCVFEEYAEFIDCKFSKRTTFFNTRFKGSINFADSEFEKHVEFILAKFHQRVDFFNTIFRQDVDFRDANFSGEARFLETRFNYNTKVLFKSSSFSGPTLFAGSNEEPIFKNVELSFNDVIISPAASLSFNNANLEKSRFSRTQVENFTFNSVKWPYLEDRICTFDEIKNSEEKKFNNLEELYRQLKLNYESRKNYILAGEFHYGEKETQRKNPNTKIYLKTLLTIYKLFSGYGERAKNSFFSLLVLLIIAASSYFFFGFEAINEIKYHYSTNTLSSFGNALLFSVKSTFFVRPLGYELSTYGSEITFIIQTIFSPVLIGLFALAIRQKLKR